MRSSLPLLLAILLAAPRLFAAEPVPLTRAHAHNDYEHKRPLFEALERGYCSVEADIHLVDGQLLVAHDAKNVKPDRTLAALYLDPLRARVRANGGRVFRNGPTVTLLVDVKTDAVATCAALAAALRPYADMLSEFTASAQTLRAITILVSGNRDIAGIAAQPRRFVVIDGRPADLAADTDSRLIPIISDNWDHFSKWKGTGEFPAEDRAKVAALVQKAHAQGRTVRFWSTADKPAMWQQLLDCGVDIIGADNLAGLQAFLLQQPPQAPATNSGR